jgi:hypothetical protein
MMFTGLFYRNNTEYSGNKQTKTNPPIKGNNTVGHDPKSVKSRLNRRKRNKHKKRNKKR